MFFFLLASWGQSYSSDILNLVLVYAPNVGWQCVLDVPLDKTILQKTQLPLKTAPIERPLERQDRIRLTPGKEHDCCCDRLSDYYFPNGKHKLFKPAGHGESKCLATLLQIIGWYNKDLEKTIDQVIKLSIISFDIESLCIDETTIPIKKIGIATKNDNTYTEGKHVVQTQVPYLIGSTCFNVERGFQQCQNDHGRALLSQFKKGALKEDTVFQSLRMYFPPEEFQQLLATIFSQQKSQVFHIGDNHKKHVQTEPNAENIEAMVVKWLRYCYIQAKMCKLLKRMLLKDLMDRLKIVIEEIKVLADRRYSDIFSKALQKCQSLIQETFLISFNGANYDTVLIEKFLWNAAVQYKFKLNMFKKSTSIQSVNIKITKWLQETACPISLTMKDVRNLEEPNVNLATLGKKYNLEISKGLFPHAISDGIVTLKETKCLPSKESEIWYNILSHSKPSDQDIEQAHADFEECSAQNLYDYAKSYLCRDVEVLFNVFFKILEAWKLSGVNIVLAR